MRTALAGGHGVPSSAVKYFEDFVVGEERIHTGSYMLTEAELREVGERWDPQPFHVDPVAAKASLFGGLVASSVHLFAILTAIGRRQPEEHRVAAVSALGFDKLRNHAPARPGDELRARIKILEARASKSRPDLGVVRNSASLFNQQGEDVFSWEAAYLVQRRPSGS
jgi:acyl dehydratase